MKHTINPQILIELHGGVQRLITRGFRLGDPIAQSVGIAADAEGAHDGAEVEVVAPDFAAEVVRNDLVAVGVGEYAGRRAVSLPRVDEHALGGGAAVGAAVGMKMDTYARFSIRVHSLRTLITGNTSPL